MIQNKFIEAQVAEEIPKLAKASESLIGASWIEKRLASAKHERYLLEDVPNIQIINPTVQWFLMFAKQIGMRCNNTGMITFHRWDGAIITSYKHAQTAWPDAIRAN